MSALLTGEGVTEIAEKFGLPHSTISTYKSQIPAEKLDELRRKKGERLDELMYDYLVAGLTAMRRQAEATSRKSYIHRQNATGLATLHGVLADKIFRLLSVTTKFSADERPQRTDHSSPAIEAGMEVTMEATSQ